MKREFNDKWLYIPILILGVYLITRLINQSQLIWMFPLDKYNDWASYLAQMHFLKECGFHSFCPYWYNGFTAFQITQPGWYFFFYPLYLITKNVQLTGYLALIITLILSLIALYIGYKKLDLSKTKSLASFLFFFGNAIAIGNFVRLGKVHELFAWFNGIVIFLFLLYYKDKRLDKNFFFIIPFYFLAIITHQNLAIISSFAFLGLILIKNNKERIKIIISMLISIFAASFWLIDYIKNFFSTTSKTIIVGSTLSKINVATYNDNIVATVIPLIFFITLYFYIKSIKNKKTEFIFLLPVSFVSFILLTRLIIFIPVLNHVFPDSYALFLLFFVIFMLFKIDYNLINKKYLIVGLIILSLTSVALNEAFTPKFIKHTNLEEETISLFENVENKYIILGSPLRKTSYQNAYYSYAAIYYNLSTAGGWYPSATTPEYINKIENLDNLLKNKECSELKSSLNKLNVKEVITYEDNCKFLSECEFNKKVNKSRACLYSLG